MKAVETKTIGLPNSTAFNEEMLSNLLAISSEGVLVFNVNTFSIVMANKRMEDLLGCSNLEIVGADAMLFLPEYQPNGQPSREAVAEILDYLVDHEFKTFKWQQRKVDGTLFSTKVTCKLMQAPFRHYLIAFHKDITEIEYAKIEAQKQEEIYTFLFNNTYDGVVIFDSKTNQSLDCNQRMLDYLGMSREMFLSTSPLGNSPEFQRTGESSLDKLLAVEQDIRVNKKVHITWTHLSANNELLESEVSIIKMQAPNEHIRLCTFKDITEQLEAHAVLKKKESDLLEAQHLAKMASFNYNVTTDELVWSNFGYKLMEINAKTAPKNIQHYLDMIHPNDKEDFATILNFAQESNQNFETEFRFFSPANNIVHIKFRAQYVPHPNHQIFMGTAVDITTQKEIEQNLRDTSAKYIDLFNNMYDALVIVDQEGYMSDVNLAGQKLLGYTKNELTKIRIPDIVHPDDIEKSKENLALLQTNGFYSGYVGRIIRKDGQVRYLQVNSNAIIKDGKMVGSRDIARDITALKQAEDRREKLLEQLGEVNKELKDFAYIVSHDLKAPLRAISNLSKWIMEDYHELVDDKGKEMLEMLNKRVDRMHNFIQAILDFSKITKAQSSQEHFSLQQLVNEVIETIDPPSHVDITLLNALPDYFGSKIKIQQIFQNLISNAIKHGNQDHCKITISCEANDTHFEFSIRDNGPGIDEKYFDKIFQIFQTLQSRDHFESTGIGLSIVKRIVQLYDGKIWVSSKVGEHTKFHFTLAKPK